MDSSSSVPPIDHENSPSRSDSSQDSQDALSFLSHIWGSNSSLDTIRPVNHDENPQRLPYSSSITLPSNGSVYDGSYMTTPSNTSIIEVPNDTAEIRHEDGPPASDRRPTTTPTPGHPLLLNNKTLVYPENYTCQKCQNTGFKYFDPSHPCRKCWDRFGKPFAASSPWYQASSGSASQSQLGRTFQRPLPALRPPQARAQRPPPPSPGSYSLDSPSSTNSRPMPVPVPMVGAPPPGSPVATTGDPRTGGRLCWRCGGCGTVPSLFLDEQICATCDGLGRLAD